MRTTLIVVFLAIAGIFGAGAFIFSKAQDVLPTIDQAFIDSQIDTFLEEKSQGEQSGVKYDIQGLDVTLLDDGMAIRADVVSEIRGIEVAFDVTIEGQPTYHNRKFYFLPYEDRDPEFHSFEVSGDFVPKGIGEGILSHIKIPKALEEGISETVENITQDDQLMKDIAAAAISKGLARFPIYELKGSTAKNAIAISLDKFEVVDKELIITISFWNLALYIILMGVIVLLAVIMACGMIFAPEVFIFGAVLGAFG